MISTAGGLAAADQLDSERVAAGVIGPAAN
jgi:hypothetical protein